MTNYASGKNGNAKHGHGAHYYAEGDDAQPPA